MPSVGEYISEHEGFRTRAYPDPIHGAKLPTIGYGQTQNPMVDEILRGYGLDPTRVFALDPSTQIEISPEIAAALRDASIKQTQRELGSRWPPFQAQSPEVQTALTDMGYNMGVGGILGFRNTLAALERSDLEGAINSLSQSKYAQQLPSRFRRNAELMRGGTPVPMNRAAGPSAPPAPQSSGRIPEMPGVRRSMPAQAKQLSPESYEALAEAMTPDKEPGFSEKYDRWVAKFLLKLKNPEQHAFVERRLQEEGIADLSAREWNQLLTGHGDTGTSGMLRAIAGATGVGVGTSLGMGAVRSAVGGAKGGPWGVLAGLASYPVQRQVMNMYAPQLSGEEAPIEQDLALGAGLYGGGKLLGRLRHAKQAASAAGPAAAPTPAPTTPTAPQGPIQKVTSKVKGRLRKQPAAPQAIAPRAPTISLPHPMVKVRRVVDQQQAKKVLPATSEVQVPPTADVAAQAVPTPGQQIVAEEMQEQLVQEATRKAKFIGPQNLSPTLRQARQESLQRAQEISAETAAKEARVGTAGPVAQSVNTRIEDLRVLLDDLAKRTDYGAQRKAAGIREEIELDPSSMIPKRGSPELYAALEELLGDPQKRAYLSGQVPAPALEDVVEGTQSRLLKQGRGADSAITLPDKASGAKIDLEPGLVRAFKNKQGKYSKVLLVGKDGRRHFVTLSKPALTPKGAISVAKQEVEWRLNRLSPEGIKQLAVEDAEYQEVLQTMRSNVGAFVRTVSKNKEEIGSTGQFKDLFETDQDVIEPLLNPRRPKLNRKEQSDVRAVWRDLLPNNSVAQKMNVKEILELAQDVMRDQLPTGRIPSTWSTRGQEFRGGLEAVMPYRPTSLDDLARRFKLSGKPPVKRPAPEAKGPRPPSGTRYAGSRLQTPKEENPWLGGALERELYRKMGPKQLTTRKVFEPTPQSAAPKAAPAKKTNYLKPAETKGVAPTVTRIISGGQTGADRGGLVAGQSLGIKTGGWAPKGYRTQKGSDLSLKEFGLKETTSSGYRDRTIKNVQEADGTVWFGNPDSPGGKLTLGTARSLRKPVIGNPTPEQLRSWMVRNKIKTLNVAGNREETNPGIGKKAQDVIKAALQQEKKTNYLKPTEERGSLSLTRIISGGQTGADRGGLEAGKALGVRTGGWAPKGYRTQKGMDRSLKEFGLKETTSSGYRERTIQNVKEADGTVWFGNSDSPGGKLTLGTARSLKKPVIGNPTPEQLRSWMVRNKIKTLNVAGNREETNPGIGKKARDVIEAALR